MRLRWQYVANAASTATARYTRLKTDYADVMKEITRLIGDEACPTGLLKVGGYL